MRPYFWSELVIESRNQWEDFPSNELEMEVLEDSDMEQDPARTMAILSFFLDNTRGAPFSFTLYGKRPYVQKDSSYVLPIFAKLLDHVAQWENATMKLQPTEFLVLPYIKGRLPMLRILSFVVQNSHAVQDFHAVARMYPALFSNHWGVFEDAPLLTNIGLGSLAFRFNWASLTSIHLYSLDDEGVISALRRTINLESFTTDEVSYIDAKETKIIKLPRLKHLSIHGVSLLTILEAPALKELKIKFDDEPESGSEMEESLEASQFASKTISFVLRSRCELSEFSSEFLGWRGLTDILAHMPDIHNLSLGGGRLLDDSGVFEWLGGSELPLRHLKVLSISSFFEDSELKLVQEMIARRNPMVGTIGAGPKELHMNLEGVPRSETTGLKSLESLCEDRGIRFAFDSWEGMVPVGQWFC
jgi:hypothetical protein